MFLHAALADQSGNERRELAWEEGWELLTLREKSRPWKVWANGFATLLTRAPCEGLCLPHRGLQDWFRKFVGDLVTTQWCWQTYALHLRICRCDRRGNSDRMLNPSVEPTVVLNICYTKFAFCYKDLWEILLLPLHRSLVPISLDVLKKQGNTVLLLLTLVRLVLQLTEVSSTAAAGTSVPSLPLKYRKDTPFRLRTTGIIRKMWIMWPLPHKGQIWQGTGRKHAVSQWDVMGCGTGAGCKAGCLCHMKECPWSLEWCRLSQHHCFFGTTSINSNFLANVTCRKKNCHGPKAEQLSQGHRVSSAQRMAAEKQFGCPV